MMADIESRSHHHIAGRHRMAGAALDEDLPFFGLLHGFRSGIFKNPGPFLGSHSGQPMHHAIGIDLRRGVFRVYTRRDREGKLLTRGIGIQKFDLHSVVQTQGIFAAKEGAPRLFCRIPQRIHPTEPAVVFKGTAELFDVVKRFGQQMRRGHGALGSDFFGQIGQGFLSRQSHHPGRYGGAAVSERGIAEQHGIDSRLRKPHGHHSGGNTAAYHGHLAVDILIEPAVLGGRGSQRGPRGRVNGIFNHGRFFLSAFFIVCDAPSKICTELAG